MTRKRARELAHEFRKLDLFAVAAPQPALDDYRVIVQLPEGSRGFSSEREAVAFLATKRAT